MNADTFPRLTIDTKHDWIIDHITAVETVEHCGTHCRATCRRDRKTGQMDVFNTEGQGVPDPTFQ